MKQLLAFGRSGEGIGLLAGLLMLAAWHLLSQGAFTAPLLLAVIVFISSLAALIVGACWRRAGGFPDVAVKKGVVGAATAAIVAAACFVLLAEGSKTPTGVLAWLVAGGLSVLPAMFAGLLAAALAALSFAPKPGENADYQVLRPALPKAICWSARVIISVLAIRALAAPLFSLQQAPPSHFTTPGPLAPPKPSFAFTPPPEMASAHALQWVPAGRRFIGRTNGRTVALTRDERWIAFIEEGSSKLRIADLFSLELKPSLVLPFAAGRLAFNQEGDKVFAVSGADPLFAGVADVAKREVTILPKPKSHAIPSGGISWINAGTVLISSLDGKRTALNLNTLEADPFPGTFPSSALAWNVSLDDRSTWNASPVTGCGKWQARIRITEAELPETTGTPEWQVKGLAQMAMSDPERNCAVLIPGMDIANDDVYFPSRDGSRMVRLRDSALEAFYFGLRPAPVLVWTLPMPHGPAEGPNGKEIVSQIDSGKLSALVYAPMVNPLNGKLVGPDRTRLKGRLSVKAWTGSTAQVTLAEEFQPFSQGDVVADLHTTAAQGFELRQLRTPYRWWTALPEASPYATSPDSIPTFADYRKREDEARRIANAEEERKREEEREKEKKERERAQMAEKAGAAPPAMSPSAQRAQGKEIFDFLAGHHRKASKGDLDGLVRDYAEKVDHFSNGMKDRAFIRDDEKKYRQGLKSLRETIDQRIDIQPLPGGNIEVRYTMRNEWVTTAGKAGNGAFIVLLEMTKTPFGWQILKQRSAKKT